MRVAESWEARVCMRVDESWEARVCMRVDESWEAKVCMRVDESWEARVCMRVAESWEARVCMRVDESWEAKVWVDESWLDIVGQTSKNFYPLLWNLNQLKVNEPYESWRSDTTLVNFSSSFVLCDHTRVMRWLPYSRFNAALRKPSIRPGWAVSFVIQICF
jgi:hypothetical protein